MPPALKIEEATIVLRGSFNPAIFQPAWFVRNGLLPEAEVEKPENLLVSSDFTSFTTKWLRLEIGQDRFAARCADAAHLVPLSDLVLGTFQLLEHTPFHLLGLNKHLDYQMESEADWHEIGDKLAPKEFWQPLFEGRPGMRSLVAEGKRPGSAAKFVRVTVEPSLRIRPHGVFIETNEHYQEEEGGEGVGAKLLAYVREAWVPATAFANKVADALFSYALRRDR